MPLCSRCWCAATAACRSAAGKCCLAQQCIRVHSCWCAYIVYHNEQLFICWVLIHGNQCSFELLHINCATGCGEIQQHTQTHTLGTLEDVQASASYLKRHVLAPFCTGPNLFYHAHAHAIADGLSVAAVMLPYCKAESVPLASSMLTEDQTAVLCCPLMMAHGAAPTALLCYHSPSLSKLQPTQHFDRQAHGTVLHKP